MTEKQFMNAVEAAEDEEEALKQKRKAERKLELTNKKKLKLFANPNSTANNADNTMDEEPNMMEGDE